jgi:cysteine desulfurase / selenocysteine lyase
LFETGVPDQVGGGTVDLVTLDEVIWSDPPNREEAGSPNVIGAIALGSACEEIIRLGINNITQHEQNLYKYAISSLRELPLVRILGDSEYGEDRLGVITFNLEGIHHHLVAAILGHEHGIAVRSGCFCAHLYLLKLLGIEDYELINIRREILRQNKQQMPGGIRISFGLYNTTAEIDALADALSLVSTNQYSSQYVHEEMSGEFVPLMCEEYSINDDTISQVVGRLTNLRMIS